MRGLSDPDSKIYALLNRMTLMIELNFWVILCCLPVVTAGAAFSSMHAVLLKIYRDEEKRITADFFQAMKGNLKNGTALWVLFLLFLAMLAVIGGLAARLIPNSSVYVLFGLLVAAVLGLLVLDWALILQSRYVYTIPQCLKNAVLAWLSHPGSTFVYLVSLVIPVLFCLSIQVLPLILLGGITLPHMISTTLYSQVFDQLEGVPPRLPKL
jgi:uncharacterized membrane protein YesL